MPIAYISGPMRGIKNSNRAEFNRVDTRLCRAGWIVFNPADMDPPGHVDNGTLESLRAYAWRDLEILATAMRGEDGDAIVILKGWWQSWGSIAECAVGRWLQLRIMTVEAACRR
jgi:hypothetical protein